MSKRLSFVAIVSGNVSTSVLDSPEIDTENKLEQYLTSVLRDKEIGVTVEIETTYQYNGLL